MAIKKNNIFHFSFVYWKLLNNFHVQALDDDRKDVQNDEFSERECT